MAVPRANQIPRNMFTAPGFGEWGNNHVREATELEADQVLIRVFAHVSTTYETYSGVAAPANLAAFNLLARNTKELPPNFKVLIMGAFARFFRDNGTTEKLLERDHIRTITNAIPVAPVANYNWGIGGAPAANHNFWYRTPDTGGNWIQYGPANRHLMSLRLDWFLDACREYNVSSRNVMRRLARTIYYDHFKRNKQRSALAIQGGMPPNYSWLACDFFDTCHMNSHEQMLFDCWKQVMLSRAGEAEWLNTANVYNMGRNYTAGRGGRFPRITMNNN